MLPQIDVFSILAIFLAIGAVYIIGVLLVLPIKIIVRLVINGIIGAIALFIINIFGGLFGLTIGINPMLILYFSYKILLFAIKTYYFFVLTIDFASFQ
jgi:inhibitor of the pro-sigma K processing machinery